MTSPRSSPEALIAERASVADAREIHRLIRYWVDETGDVLPRTEGEIYENIRDFVVVRSPAGKRLLAAGALHVEWLDLAEIKSLVVDPSAQGEGLGRVLVQACLDEARQLGLKTVFALTTTPAFFERLGFRTAGVSTFPRKVWNECFRCPKYDHCDEVAVSIDLTKSRAIEDHAMAGEDTRPPPTSRIGTRLSGPAAGGPDE